MSKLNATVLSHGAGVVYDAARATWNKMGAIVPFPFTDGELSHRKDKCLAQGHTDNSRQIQDTNPSQLAPDQIR